MSTLQEKIINSTRLACSKTRSLQGLYIYYLTTPNADADSLRSIIKNGLKKEIYDASRGNINRNIRVAQYVLDTYQNEILSLLDSESEENSIKNIVKFLTKNQISTCTLAKATIKTKNLDEKIQDAIDLLLENHDEYKELIESQLAVLFESESESESESVAI